MGRKILVGENPSIHPIISLSLLVAGMAAIVALVSSLCVTRKKLPPPSTSQRKTTENLDVVTTQPNEAATPPEMTTEPQSTIAVESEGTKDMSPPQNEEPQLPLPPPPGMPHLRGAVSYHQRTDSWASQGKLPSSMSMRVQGGGMSSRQQSRREDQNDKKLDKKLNHEDSIWKKAIILGEKCRVPDEDDTIICDDKGNKISTYHPKNPSSLPLSRQTSSIDPEAIPSSGTLK